LSVLCGALEWRPHLAISGPAASGKTTLLKTLNGILYPFALTFEGVSTEAGIRQSLGPDARPIIIDELESGGARDLGRLNRFAKLILSASGATGEIARGTPEGKAILYNVRTMFAFGAINIYTSNAAEASRLLRVELRQPEGDRAHRETIVTLARKLENVGPAFCQLAIDYAEDILQSTPLLHQQLKVMQEREADNLAPVLAAHFVLLNRRVITPDEARELAARFEPVLAQQRERLQGQDHIECLNALLGYTITIERKNQYSGELVGELIRREIAPGSPRLSPRYIENLQMQLSQLGLRIEEDALLVPTSHPGLKQVFRGTPWDGGLWGSALERIEGAQRTPQRRFPGSVRSLGIRIPISSLGLSEEPS
jgi:putative DNA primase/helicase